MVEIIQSTNEQKIQWERAAQIAGASGVSWLLVFKPEDILLLCGIWPQSSMNLLLVSPEQRRAHLIAAENALEGRLVPDELDVIGYNYVSLWKPNAETTIKETLERLVGKAERLGFPLSDEYASVSPLLAEIFDMKANLQQVLRSGWPSLTLVDISNPLARVRAVKNEGEIAAIQRPVEISEVGVTVLYALEKNFTSISEAELALQIQHKIEAEAVARGLRARAWAQISSGPRTGTAAYLDFVEPTQRIIKKGELVLLELVTIVEGFWADLTYPIQAGGWSQPSTMRIYEAVRNAQANAVEALVPGATGADIDAAAREILRERGFEREFFHSTGHSVGFRYHENYPLLAPESNDQIAIGHVVTVEPGAYGAGFGLRLEADVAVTKEGPKWLSRRPIALT
jgi:Xaa-Pro aminopeptidase